MIDVFIGYDEGEKISYHILAESIRRNSSQPVSITPLCLSNIPEFTREKQDNQSTDFAFSRFMVPSLRKYQGYSIFMDCDMMFRGDIAELWQKRNYIYSVMCCKHDYEPTQHAKFRGAKNEKFEIGNSKNDDFKPLDYGVRVGLGLNFNSLDLGATYNWGMTTIATDATNGFSAKNRFFQMVLIYKV